MRETKPLEIEPDKWCVWCGDSLPEKEERPHNKIYCSRRCKDDAANDKARQEWAALLETKPCLHCHTPFKQTRRNQIFCGPNCSANAAYRRKTGRPVAIADKTCPYCQKMFTPGNLQQKYCSKPCSKLAHIKRKAM